jgi:hypothetical protein
VQGRGMLDPYDWWGSGFLAACLPGPAMHANHKLAAAAIVGAWWPGLRCQVEVGPAVSEEMFPRLALGLGPRARRVASTRAAHGGVGFPGGASYRRARAVQSLEAEDQTDRRMIGPHVTPSWPPSCQCNNVLARVQISAHSPAGRWLHPRNNVLRDSAGQQRADWAEG